MMVMQMERMRVKVSLTLRLDSMVTATMKVTTIRLCAGVLTCSLLVTKDTSVTLWMIESMMKLCSADGATLQTN